MTDILLKGCKIASQPSIHQNEKKSVLNVGIKLNIELNEGARLYTGREAGHLGLNSIWPKWSYYRLSLLYCNGFYSQNLNYQKSREQNFLQQI